MIKSIDLKLLVLTLILLLFGLLEGVEQYSGLFFLIILLTVGIPHGSLDHLIYYKNNGPKTNKVKFYIKYLTLIALVGVAWVILPTLSFILFLFISGFHFGQSQLYNIKTPELLSFPYHLSWGMLLLSVIILTNLGECLTIFTSLEWLNTTWVTRETMIYSTIASATIFGSIHTFLFLKYSMPTKQYFFELILLVVFSLMAMYTNAIFTFTVYFGLWHSYRSLILEYKTIKTNASYGIRSFLKDISPFSIIGIAFLFAAYGISTHYDLGISFYMIFIIIISTLTVPHLIVMHNLYTK